jgi:hypothetical protein
VPLETSIQAKYTRNRDRLLEHANLALKVLRFQMRLAKSNSSASPGFLQSRLVKGLLPNQ